MLGNGAGFERGERKKGRKRERGWRGERRGRKKKETAKSRDKKANHAVVITMPEKNLLSHGRCPRPSVRPSGPSVVIQRNWHFLFFLLGIPTPESRFRLPLPAAADAADSSWFLRSLATTVRMARSKISSTPRISLLLHSMYSAFIFLATTMACSVVTGVRPCVLSMSMHVFLYRRSDLRPTRTRGV